MGSALIGVPKPDRKVPRGARGGIRTHTHPWVPGGLSGTTVVREIRVVLEVLVRALRGPPAGERSGEIGTVRDYFATTQ